MVEGLGGFLYPYIDEEKCVRCGICEQVCGFKNYRPRETEGPAWAAVSVEGALLSASGGVASAIAEQCIQNSGVVFGAVAHRSEGGLRVIHEKVDDEASLCGLRGSKYVQSDCLSAYAEAESELKLGKNVVYTGTPCEIAGLRSYLCLDYPNLLTVDIVCHGVPSGKMFKDYCSMLGKRKKKPLKNINFRSKRDGWLDSLLIEATYIDNKKLYIRARESSYYSLFLELASLRDSCYSCPFAGRCRPGDITLGDCWGIEVARPDLLKEGALSLYDGISCVIANTEKGRREIGLLAKRLRLFEVNMDDIAAGNAQLVSPPEKPAFRRDFIEMYDSMGWGAIEKKWQRGRIHRRIRFIARKISNSMSRVANSIIKRNYSK